MRRIIAALALVACQQPIEQRQISGVFTYGFEHNSFSSDEGAGEWCLAQDSIDLLGIERPPRMDIVGTELTIDAEISPPGHYGHMGLCQQEIRIRRVIERRDIDCVYATATCALLTPPS